MSLVDTPCDDSAYVEAVAASATGFLQNKSAGDLRVIFAHTLPAVDAENFHILEKNAFIEKLHGQPDGKVYVRSQAGRSNMAAVEAITPEEILASATHWHDVNDVTTLFIDAGITQSTAVGDLIYQINDKTGNGNHYVQATSSSRLIRGTRPKGGVRNILLNTTTLTTQNATTAAVQYTLSFKGTGTVTLTGTSTAGPLVGTGANDIVTLTFTPTAGTLTLTVSGTAEEAQLETGAVRTNYQRRGEIYDITEAGQEQLTWLYADGVDDFMTVPGSAAAGTYNNLHNGLGGSWYGVMQAGVVPNPNAHYPFISSQANGNQVGTILFWDDRSSVPRNETFVQLVGDGTNIVINMPAADNTYAANRPGAVSNSYLTQSGNDALTYLNNVLVVSSAELFTPSTGNPVADLRLGALTDGTVFLTGFFETDVAFSRVLTPFENDIVTQFFISQKGVV